MMQPGFDINKLRQEAKIRWLKPSEVLFILQNHERYRVTFEAPYKPPSGSLFLFNRRVLRFFRKDGHPWRKKKDGRTVGEGHERLKIGNVETLNCYYAHGEQSPYFQRRSYWMLDPAYEHIVLVHYREVSEGRCISGPISNLSADSFPAFSQGTSISEVHHQGFTSGTSKVRELYQNSSRSRSIEEVNSQFAREKFETEYSNAMDSSYRMRSQVEEGGKPDSYNSMQLLKFSGDNGNQQNQSLGSGFTTERDQTHWKDTLELTSNSSGINNYGGNSNLFAPIDVPVSPNCRTSALEARLPSWDLLENGNDTLLSSAEKISDVAWQHLDHGVNHPENVLISDSDVSLQLTATRRFLLGSDDPIESPTSISQLVEVERLHSSETSTLEANASVMMLSKENSTDWIGNIDLAIENGTCSSDLSEMWFDPSQFGNLVRTDSSLTLGQNQRFSIREISPEWVFSFESTKVIITGDFLCNPLEFPWAIMFGDIEVPLEIVQEGVLRCQAPQHAVGKVTLCVTSGNRESCSEIREFEFRAKPNTSSLMATSPRVEATKSAEELLLLARFAHILLCESDASSISKDGSKPEIENSIKVQTTNSQWQQVIKALQVGCELPSDTLDWILQELLKDKFQHWLMSKYQGKEGTGDLLSMQEQGIIHVISGLGYEWALNLILDSGVGVNFRDEKGWTALHWAARFGREKLVTALLAAGASAGAVTDPTPQDPVGKTPGAISDASGHKGLAGYLSEVALTSHLSSLTMEESEISKGSAEIEAERAVESISQKSLRIHVSGIEDELSLKDSLAAVRNAAQAAARIQAAFRAHSFRKRQQKAATSQDEYGMTPVDIHELSAASKFQKSIHGYCDQKFHKAALSIQKKYRCWKGRKRFLTLHQHAVKIQAHVRGHQVRKKYKELLRTVSVLEKGILRWRRRRVGLRGFQAGLEMNDEAEDEDIVKVFRKLKVDAALDEAFSRVRSMVGSPDARQQYRRMLERYRQAKAGLGIWDEATSGLLDDFEFIENSYYMY